MVLFTARSLMHATLAPESRNLSEDLCRPPALVHCMPNFGSGCVHEESQLDGRCLRLRAAACPGLLPPPSAEARDEHQCIPNYKAKGQRIPLALLAAVLYCRCCSKPSARSASSDT